MRVNGCWRGTGNPKEKYFHLEQAKWELFFIQVEDSHVFLLKYFGLLTFSQKEEEEEKLQKFF